MPVETTITLIVLFALFGGFIAVLGGTSLWLAMDDRRNRKT
jgi:uncharacterized protein involved in exopolysaccharide biosynthesis